MTKLIRTIGKSKYYISGANSREDFNSIIFWKCYYYTDLVLKGRAYLWFFGNQFLFNEYEFKEKIPSYLEYSFDEFKADIEGLGKPKYIVIYIDQPHGSGISKTDDEIKRDNLMVIMASCNSGVF